MATIGSYTDKDFSPAAKLLSYDSSGVTALIPGQSLLDYIGFDELVIALDNRVEVVRTTDLAVTEDLPVGRVIYTTGVSVENDGGGGHYVVVIAGTGGIPMDNGNELLLLPIGDLTGSDATNADVTTSTGSRTVAGALDSRWISSLSTVAQMVAATDLAIGDRVRTSGYTTSGDGGGNDYEIVAAATGTDDGGSFIDLSNGLQAKGLFTEGNANARQFGALPTTGASPVDVTLNMQAYADYCSNNGLAFIVDCGSVVNEEYRISSEIVFSANVSVFGEGTFLPRFFCDDCSLFRWPSGTTNVTVRRIRAGQKIRHTTTPNAFTAITFPGLTGSRPYWNTVKDCFFDGFAINFNIEWAWEQRYRDNILINCGQIVRARGTSVNNHVTGNGCTGDGIGFDIGDGTVTMEGWWICNNLLDRFSQAVKMHGASYNKILDNIFDHIEGSNGVLLQGSGAIPAFGNHVRGNYIAFSFNASEGIRLLNSVASSGNTGNTIDDNEIFPYVGFTLTRGLLLDGTNELNNVITKNKITADTYDIDISATALSTILRSNVMNGPGFRTAANVFYHDNIGTVISSQTLIRNQIGRNVEVWSTNQPASGTWQQGDKVWRTNPAIDGNSMILIGWIRLTTGSGNVAGVDWAGMRVSDVSPAV